MSSEEYGSLEKELYYEPKDALTDGSDGLTFYRRILEVYAPRLKQGGAIAFEIGFAQARSVSDIAAEYGMKVQIIKDYSGHDRVAVCTPVDPA